MLTALALFHVHTRGGQTPRAALALALFYALDPHSTDRRGGGALLLAHLPVRDNPVARLRRLDGDSEVIRRARTQRVQRIVEEVRKRRAGRLLRSVGVVSLSSRMRMKSGKEVSGWD